jgi:deoxycytidine triphosphate deaminase
MGVFSNKQIKQAIDDEHIICVPFKQKHISHASLDVTLGHYYYRTERSEDHPVYNPFDKTDVKRYFEGALTATTAKAGTAASAANISPVPISTSL